MACRERYVEELGRPHGLPTAGRVTQGIRLLRHASGNPDTGQYRNLHGTLESGDGEAEEYCERESLPDADGESYQA